LIDYESHSVERVRGVLREPDYEVVAAHDGEEALATFGGSTFDLVLLSGMLPRLPSAEVIREIRRRGGPAAPPILLMVSGYKGANPKADAQRVGAFDLLPRPFSDETLREAAARAIVATAATAKAAANRPAAAASLTASDIFSDILEEVTREASPPPAAHKPAADTAEEVERRLRDTLSGVLPKPGAPAPKPAPKSSTDADVERLLNETLSGLRRETKPRPAAAPPASAGTPGTPSAAPEPSVPFAPAGEAVQPPPDRFGQYEILERISSGGMAELFRARLSGAEGFRKTVAIKKILPHIAGDEEFLAMFADEAKLAAQLSHPNIVHIFDLGKIESGGYFIAMEYVEGHDLRSILHLARENGIPMPISLAVSIAAKVASALDYAHRRRGDDGTDLRIVHRDVSPANILVSNDGDVKLCDFGIAKASSKVSRTESGALKGKLPYMSPEQAWGMPLDHRSDVYSLGSVLFEMLAGRKLFTGDSEVAVLEKVRAGEAMAPSKVNPDVPPALDTLVLKALSREPSGRYASASDMLRELEGVLRTYEPPPSSGELAVYVRHLEAEDAARKEARARDAALPPPPVPEAEPEPEGKPVPEAKPAPKKPAAAAAPSARKAERPKKEVRVPVREEAAAKPATPPPKPAAKPASQPPPKPAPKPGAAAPPIFASALPETTEPEAQKRTRLYAMIAAAVVILAVGIVLLARKPAPPAAPAPAPTAAATAPPAAAPTVAPTAPPAPDPRAIQEEAQRQLALRRKAAAEAAARAARSGVAAQSAPIPAQAAPAPAPAPAEPTPEPKAAEPPPAPVRAEPTAVPAPTEAPPVAAPASGPAPASAPAKAENAEVSRGDLVGPGPGVVEPSLVSLPRFVYPPAARQQAIAGKVVALVLVDENGAVASARLQSGTPSRIVNDAVLQSIRGAKFQNATKNGVPVKMWRTVVVDVRP